MFPEKSSSDAVPVVLNTSNLGETEALLLKTALPLNVDVPEIEAVLESSKGEEMDTPPEKVLRADHELAWE